ncbi:hypothetical protein B566_EDAN017641, partial [Ephemera danica]
GGSAIIGSVLEFPNVPKSVLQQKRKVTCIFTGNDNTAYLEKYVNPPLEYKLALIVVVTCFVTILILAAFVIKYHIEIRMVLKDRLAPLENSGDFDYDVFVCYNSEDGHDTVGNVLLPQLEKFGYKCYVYERDAHAGANLSLLLPMALKRSRRMIIVISPGLFCDGFALHMCHVGVHEVISKRSLRIITVLPSRMQKQNLSESAPTEALRSILRVSRRVTLPNNPKKMQRFCNDLRYIVSDKLEENDEDVLYVCSVNIEGVIYNKSITLFVIEPDDSEQNHKINIALETNKRIYVITDGLGQEIGALWSAALAYSNTGEFFKQLEAEWSVPEGFTYINGTNVTYKYTGGNRAVIFSSLNVSKFDLEPNYTASYIFTCEYFSRSSTGNKEKLDSHYVAVLRFIPGDFDYDVFVCYNSEDANDTVGKVLLPQLEKFGYKCYVYERDAHAGANLNLLLPMALKRSRRMLIVVSPGLYHNGLALHLCHVGVLEAISKRSLRIITVLPPRMKKQKLTEEELSNGAHLRTILRVSRSITLPTNYGKEQQRFWKKLRLGLPPRRKLVPIISNRSHPIAITCISSEASTSLLTHSSTPKNVDTDN